MKSIIQLATGMLAGGCVLLLAGCGPDYDETTTGSRDQENRTTSPTPEGSETNPSPNPGPASVAANADEQTATEQTPGTAPTGTTGAQMGYAGTTTTGVPGPAAGDAEYAASARNRAMADAAEGASGEEMARTSGQAGSVNREGPDATADQPPPVEIEQLLLTAGLPREEVDELAANGYAQQEVQESVQRSLEESGRTPESAEERAREITRLVVARTETPNRSGRQER